MISRSRSRKRKSLSASSKKRQGRTPGSAVDPTRTVALRLAAVRLMRKKFGILKGSLVRLVTVEDAFGLNATSRRTTGNSEELVLNPFISEAQRKACYTKDDPDWDCSEWEEKTGNKKLPKKKASTENVDRIEMPQIRKEHWQRFLEYARERTTLTEGSGVDPKSLRAVQSEFDQDRVDSIQLELLKKWPILISQDSYVLDGNHRWIKAYQADHPLKVLKLGLDKEDALSLMREFPQSEFVENRFQFLSSPDKVLEFQKWLRQQFKSVLLGKSDEELWAEFARKGFEKGAGRAFDDVNRVNKVRWAPFEGDFYGGTRREFLRSSFGRPETTDKLRLLAGRSFTDLRNVTEDMATRMSRTLMDGLSRGANPRELVDDLVEDLDVSESRAEAIARTEIIRAHAEGQLDSMEKLGVEEVGVAVEWDTAKDGRVCVHCQPLQGVVLTIDEAHGLIPAHPNCRCAFVPANVGEDTSNQKRTKQEILDAFEEAEIEPPELDDERPKSLISAMNQQQSDDEEYHFHRDQQEDAAEISSTMNELHEFSHLRRNL